VTFVDLFLVFLKASFLSSGGLAPLPLLQQELIAQRALLTSADFASALAIGRIGPGPNGKFVLSIGYYAAGIPGFIAALLGMTLPPFLAIGLVRAHRRLATRPWVIGLTRGITASSVGLLGAVAWSFTEPLLGAPALLVILVLSLVVLVVTRVDPLPVLGLGGAAGVVLYFLGIPLS
jgi:chromate transporter